MNTIKSIINKTSQTLINSGNTNAEFEARYIISEVLNCSQLDLHMNQTKELSPNQIKTISDATLRRCSNEPLQYIFGKAYFMNLTFEVGPGVLIPRPETELLVDYVCKHCPRNATICDIGTGSGTISVSIAYERPDTNVIGVDLHEKALTYARKNKNLSGVNNLELIQSDLFSSLCGEKFDVITANLPYISQKEYNKLEDEVKEHEPKSALYADDEGLALITQTILEAPQHLNKNGLIIFEIGYEQGAAVKKLLEKNDNYTNAEVIKDYNNLDRFVKAQHKG